MIAIPIEKTSPKQYIKLMYHYGLLTVLYILEHFEKLEDYEECEKIMQAIRSEEQRLETTIFTKATSEAIETVLETYRRFGLTGKYAVANSKDCTEMFINKLKK